MTGETKECNNCVVDNCNSKESKKRTDLLDGTFNLYCVRYRKPQPLKRLMVEIAMWSELVMFGEIKNVSKLGNLKLEV